MFSILAQNQWRGWQNFEEKNWRGVSRDSFFLKILSPSEPILKAKIENMILSDYVLCYIPRVLEIFRKFKKEMETWVIIFKELWSWGILNKKHRFKRGRNPYEPKSYYFIWVPVFSGSVNSSLQLGLKRLRARRSTPDLGKLAELACSKVQIKAKWSFVWQRSIWRSTWAKLRKKSCSALRSGRLGRDCSAPCSSTHSL